MPPSPGSQGFFLVFIRTDSLSKPKRETSMGGELPSFLAHGSAKDNVCVTVTPWEVHRAHVHGLHVFVQKQLCSSMPTFKKKQFLGIFFLLLLVLEPLKYSA